MRILQWYLAKNLFSGWVLAFAVAGAVFGLLFLIAEMDRLGGAYQFADAAIYTVYTLPQRLFQLLPVIILLGSMLSLVNLESGNELTIFGVSGLGSAKLIQLMLIPLLVLMSVIWFGVEYVTPRLNGYGEEHKISTYGSISRFVDQASWSRYDSGYVHLGMVDREGKPRNIEIFQFNDDGSLRRAIFAKQADVVEDRLWQLRDVVIKETSSGRLSTHKVESLDVDNLWLAQELPILKLSTDSMPPSLLYGYGKFLEDNGQHYRQFALSFWKQMTLPLTCAAMLILAVPLGGRPGISRNSSLGLQMGLGTLIGIIFYLGSQIVYALGEILGWHPAVSCLLPIVVTVSVASALLARSRW